MASEKIIELNASNFGQEVGGQQPILVDFWAPWCGPCHMVAPALDQLADEMDGTVRIGKLNVDSAPEVAAQYQVQGIPTLLLFKNGVVADRMVGAAPKSAMEGFVARNL